MKNLFVKCDFCGWRLQIKPTKGSAKEWLHCPCPICRKGEILSDYDWRVLKKLLVLKRLSMVVKLFTFGKIKTINMRVDTAGGEVKVTARSSTTGGEGMEKYSCASDSLRPRQLDRMVATIKDFNPIARANWHKKYMDTMKANGGLNDDEAKVCLEASMPDFDYKDDPVDTAIEEMTYWID